MELEYCIAQRRRYRASVWSHPHGRGDCENLDEYDMKKTRASRRNIILVTHEIVKYFLLKFLCQRTVNDQMKWVYMVTIYIIK